MSMGEPDSDRKYEHRSDRKVAHEICGSGGKYAFVSYLGCVVDVARYGNAWIDNLADGNGSNAISALMSELDAARVVIAAARAYLAESAQAGLRPHRLIADAIAKHAALCDDREPPSAWCGVTGKAS